MFFSKIKDQNNKLVDAYTKLFSNYKEMEKRVKELEERIVAFETIKESILKEQEVDKNMIDDDGNYNYQKIKQRNLDRRNGKGEN